MNVLHINFVTTLNLNLNLNYMNAILLFGVGFIYFQC